MADIGSDKICTITATFYDSSGSFLPGIRVVFTPDNTTEAFLSSGIIALEAAADSDEDGVLSLPTIRGLTGTLTIAGLGISRHVTIPNVATTPLDRLIESAPDPLEIQKQRFIPLPRRS